MSPAADTHEPLPLPEAVPEPPRKIAAPLPEDALLRVIERRSRWEIINLREVWRFHELLFFMVWRDVKVRYKQTVLGASWAILQPLSQMVVFTIFFHRMAEVSSGDAPYPLFAFAGLLAWTFFANCVTQASQSIVGNQNLISKVYFPRIFVPGSAIGTGLVDFLIGCGMLVVMMIGYRVWPSWTVLALPPLVLAIAATAFGVGTLLAALTVEYRDFRYVVPFLVQIWMFATPCIYMNAAGQGPRWQLALPFNPLYGLILNFRAAALGEALDWYALLVSSGVMLLCLLTGLYYFRRVERTFADVI